MEEAFQDWSDMFGVRAQWLLDQGYLPRAPDDEAADIDAELCSHFICAECGHWGLGYRPFCRPGSYRVLAPCPRCGYTEEV